MRYQRALEKELTVPVVTSTPLSYGAFQQNLSESIRVAILTIDKAALRSTACAAANIPHDALIFDLPGESHLRRAIFESSFPLDVPAAEREWVNFAASVQREHPCIGQWLFECGNTPPYTGAVVGTTGVAFYDALAMGNALYRSVQP